MPSKALFSHVLVDKFEIVDGPGTTVCANAIVRDEAWFEIRVSLKTPASKQHFNGTLRITGTGAMTEGKFLFLAIYQGHEVSGEYDTYNRTGWFSAK